MRHQTKYFVFNKERDFARGSHYGIKVLEPGITLLDANGGGGSYYSRLLDSREKQMLWHRMLVEGDTVSEASVRFFLYASEDRRLFWKDREWDIGEILEDTDISNEEKQKLLKPYCVKVADNPRDILLHDIKGRYLWFQVQLKAQGQMAPVITKIKIIFPKNTWLQYLPDVYQENRSSASFVERYLGMFQSLYQDMTEEIQRAPQYLDPDAVGGEFLQWLSTWLSIEDSYIWNEEQLRYLLRNGLRLYRKRGTVDYLKEMVKLYTGREPYVVEHHQLEPYLGNHAYGDKLLVLYGENSYIFTVIVDKNGQIGNKEYQVLTRIIERAKPAHMESNIVVLEPYIFLDRHSYLGINSVLGNYGAFVLDGQSSIPFTTLTGNEE